MTNVPIRMLVLCLVVSLTPEGVAASASAADTIESLRRQLAAQQAINEQLHARVRLLERQLARVHPGEGSLLVGLDADADRPPVEPESANSAIEAALVTKGLVLLPGGSFRFTPRVTWLHDGQGEERDDSLVSDLTLEAGLPWGLAGSLSLPYVQRDHPLGRRDGWGDFALGLAKQLTQETAHRPSLVARLTYTHDNGADPFGPVPIGGGFPAVTAALSALERDEPVALYGTLSYRHAWAKSVTFWDGTAYRSGHIRPHDSYGLNLGVSLAATPDISLNAGISFAVAGRDRILPRDGESYETRSATVGYIDLGADFVLGRDLFLTLSAAAGVTDDASDFVFSLALPYRF